MSSLTDKLEKKIKAKKAKIGIIGMGYVGIPLGLGFAGTGFSVTGFDKNPARVKEINSGKQVMKHISKKQMKDFVDSKGSATTEFSVASDLDCLIICVPTPLDEHEQPDMSYVERASSTIGRHLKKGQLVVLESATYPGTTREVVLSLIHI